jgi:hypothetical protein
VLPKISPKSVVDACDSLLTNKKIRFICVLDKMGKMVHEKKQRETKLLIPSKKARSLFIHSALEVSLKKDFDKQIGLLQYNVSRRDKVDTITIPIYDYVVLITVNPHENCDAIARSAIKVFEKVFKN